MHKHLIDNLYLSDLLKHLHEYIHHCLQCQLMQTFKYNFYEFMQFIFTSLWLFYVFMIDFMLVLFTLSDRHNIIFSVTDKFSKMIIFILKQKTMTVKNWVIHLLDWLVLLNWDLLWTILSDHNRNFTAIL